MIEWILTSCILIAAIIALRYLMKGVDYTDRKEAENGPLHPGHCFIGCGCSGLLHLHRGKRER